MICPNCGDEASFEYHLHDWVETHGLDSGPYENCHQEWLECSECGAHTDAKELEEMNA